MAHGQKKPRRAMSRAEMAMRSPVWGAGKNKPMEMERQAKLGTDARMALQRVVLGAPKDDDPEELAVSANVSLILCEWGFGEEYLPAVKEAQAALVAAQARHTAGQPYAFTEPERAAMAQLMDLYEAHTTECTYLTVMRALAEAADRIRAGHAIRAVPGLGTRD